MNQADLEYIVNLVTQQVMSAMGNNSPAVDPHLDGLSKILVGPQDLALPEDLCQDSVAYGLEDYCAHKNILRYDRVIITSLNTTQLADIAMARVSDDVTDAVITALLNGIDTYMLESAAPCRSSALRWPASAPSRWSPRPSPPSIRRLPSTSLKAAALPTPAASSPRQRLLP